MGKRFSTVQDTQKVSLSYMEKRSGRREVEVTRSRGGIKRGESNLASKAWNTQRGSWSYREKKRGSKEIEVTRRRREGSGQKERDRSSQ